MKRIKKIIFSYLRNEAHYEFLFFFINLLNKFPDVKQLITPLYQAFFNLLAIEKKLIDAARSSNYTQELEEEDYRIDHDVAGIKAGAKAALYSTDPAVVKAAKELLKRLDDFGDIKVKAYEEESAAVQILLDDLQTTFNQQVRLVGIDALVKDLSEAEDTFVQLYEQRNAELADRPQEHIRDVRRQIEGIYNEMIAIIVAAVITKDDSNYNEFIAQLNKNIVYFNEHNHRHARKDLSVTDHCVIEPIATQTYTGKPITILPNAYYREEGKETVDLVFSVDYTVTYKNNTDVGMAELTIHGKGKYRGQKTATFNIS